MASPERHRNGPKHSKHKHKHKHKHGRHHHHSSKHKKKRSGSERERRKEDTPEVRVDERELQAALVTLEEALIEVLFQYNYYSSMLSMFRAAMCTV